VSSKEGTFFEESGHDSREKNSVNFWPKYFSAVGGLYGSVQSVHPYSPYRFGTEIEAIFGTVFEAIFRFSVVVFGPYGTVRTVDCGHGKRGTEEAGQRYGFGTENEADFCGTDLVL
jgi:hypothetical protein